MSTKLTKAQTEYAVNRLSILLAQRLETVNATITEPTPVERLTFAEKYAVIKAGKAVLKPLDELNYRNDLEWAYNFPQHEAKVKAYQQELAKYTVTCEKLQKPIQASYRVAMDTLMLGDAAAALEVIERFASGK